MSVFEIDIARRVKLFKKILLLMFIFIENALQIS